MENPLEKRVSPVRFQLQNLSQIIVIGTSGVGVSKTVGNQVASVQVVLWMVGVGAGGAGGADLGGHAVERLGRLVHGWCAAFKQRFQRFLGGYIRANY